MNNKFCASRNFNSRIAVGRENANSAAVDYLRKATAMSPQKTVDELKKMFEETNKLGADAPKSAGALLDEKMLRIQMQIELESMKSRMEKMQSRLDNVASKGGISMKTASESKMEVAAVSHANELLAQMVKEEVARITGLVDKMEGLETRVRTVESSNSEFSSSVRTLESSLDSITKGIASDRSARTSAAEQTASALSSLEARLKGFESTAEVSLQAQKAEAARVAALENSIRDLKALGLLSSEQQQKMLGELGQLRIEAASVSREQNKKFAGVSSALDSVWSDLLNARSVADSAVRTADMLGGRIDKLGDSTTTGLESLREAVKQTNMEIDETMEAIGDKQSQMMEVARQEVSRAEQAMQSQVQALGGRLSQVDAKITDARSASAAAIETLRLEVAGNIEVEARRVAELSSQVEEKLQTLDTDVTARIDEAVTTAVTNVREPVLREAKVAVDTLRSEVIDRIGTVESSFTKRTAEMEKKSDAELQKLVGNFNNNLDFLRGSVDLKVKNAQREILDASAVMDTKVAALDGSIEARVEEVIERTSVRAAAKRAVKGVLSSVRTRFQSATAAVKNIVRRDDKVNKALGEVEVEVEEAAARVNIISRLGADEIHTDTAATASTTSGSVSASVTFPEDFDESVFGLNEESDSDSDNGSSGRVSKREIIKKIFGKVMGKRSDVVAGSE
jgi:chromosome segregation ATPase